MSSSKGVRVFLETGDIKLISTAAEDSFEELAKGVAGFLGITVTAHYAIRLEHQEARLSQWLNPSLNVFETEKRLMGPDQKERWKYLFRLRYLMGRPSELLDIDGVSYNYFYEQILNRFASGQFPSISALASLKLGCLAIQQRHMDSGAKKFDYDKFEVSVGLSKVLPPSAVLGLKAKDVKKLVSSQRKEYSKLTSAQCKASFFELFLAEMPAYGTVPFPCHLVIGNEGFPQSELLIGHDTQISRRIDREKAKPLASFKSIISINLLRGERKVDIMFKVESGVPLMVATFEDPKVADEMVTLIDGYVKLSTNPSESVLNKIGVKHPENDATRQRRPSSFVSASDNFVNPSDRPTPIPKRISMQEDGPPPALPSRTSSILRVDTQQSTAAIQASLLSPSSAQKLRSDARSSSFAKVPRDKMSMPPPPTAPNTLHEAEDENPTFLQISRNELKIGEILGEGQFGNVYEGMWGDRAIAIKMLKADSDPNERVEFLKEATIMSKLDHAHIVRMLGVCLSTPVLIVTELMPLGNLRNYLRENQTSLEEFTLVVFMWQICSALCYLEERKLVHRDIATRNVLVYSKSVVKVSDFGLSRSVHEENFYSSTGGKLPIKWLAPECINFRRFTTASDVWSFGVCCWEMMTYGEKPFKDLKNRDVIQTLEDGVRLARPQNCPNDMFWMMQSTWAYHPNGRPTFAQLYIDIAQMVRKRGGLIPESILSSIQEAPTTPTAADERVAQQIRQQKLIEEKLRKMKMDEESAEREEQERLQVLKDRVNTAQTAVRKRLFASMEGLLALAKASRDPTANFIELTTEVCVQLKGLLEDSMEASDIPNMSHTVCEEIDKVADVIKQDLTALINLTKRLHNRSEDVKIEALIAELMQQAYVLAQNSGVMWSIIGTVRIVLK